MINKQQTGYQSAEYAKMDLMAKFLQKKPNEVGNDCIFIITNVQCETLFPKDG